MFNFMKSAAYWWPVTIRVPAEDDIAKRQVITFEVQFPRETTEQINVRRAAVAVNGLDDPAYARGLVIGFRKLYAPDDTEVPFNADSLEALIKVPGAGTAIAMAHADSTDQISQKN